MTQNETTLTLEDINVLDCLTSIIPKITLWTGAKRMKADDLPVDNDKLPPDRLVTFGSMKVYDPKKLAVFSSLKYEATTLLKRYGIGYAMGYLIPDNVLDLVLNDLQKLQKQFETEKQNLIAAYDTDVQEWLEENKDWDSLLRKNVEDKDTVRGRFSFGWRVIKLNLAQAGDGGDAIVDSNKELADLLFQEIADVAISADKKSYLGKTSVTRKALSPLKTLHSKLKELVFVDPLVAPVITMIENAIQGIPKRGPITGPDLDMLKGLIARLSNPETMRKEATALLTGQPLALDDEEVDGTEDENHTVTPDQDNDSQEQPLAASGGENPPEAPCEVPTFTIDPISPAVLPQPDPASQAVPADSLSPAEPDSVVDAPAPIRKVRTSGPVTAGIF